LYFTVLAVERDVPNAWVNAKRAVTDAIVSNGGTVTHHHAVGTAHKPWLAQEIGQAGVDAINVLRDRFDPQRILNPGKLT
jgi:alkyldihydroxyacetonephosphate synthase